MKKIIFGLIVSVLVIGLLLVLILFVVDSFKGINDERLEKENEFYCDSIENNRIYVSEDVKECQLVKFGCDDPRRIPFSDQCGCGCEIP